MPINPGPVNPASLAGQGSWSTRDPGRRGSWVRPGPIFTLGAGVPPHGASLLGFGVCSGTTRASCLKLCKGDSAVTALAKRQLAGLDQKKFAKLSSKAKKLYGEFVVGSLFSGCEIQEICGRELLQLLGYGLPQNHKPLAYFHIYLFAEGVKHDLGSRRFRWSLRVARRLKGARCTPSLFRGQRWPGFLLM